jgi:hypothetical protein
MTKKIPVKDLHGNVIGEAEVDETSFISFDFSSKTRVDMAGDWVAPEAIEEE